MFAMKEIVRPRSSDCSILAMTSSLGGTGRCFMMSVATSPGHSAHARMPYSVLPAMIDQKDGCILNVSSWTGRHVSDLVGPAYTATKTAVVALTHEFNIE